VIERTEVVVEPRSLDRSGGDSVTGPIWLRHGRRDEQPTAFPGEGWTDFPVIVAAWWLAALNPLLRGDGLRAACRFMDGPYEFSVLDVGESLVEVHCTGSKRFHARKDQLHASVRDAAEGLLSECGRRGWSGPDIEVLTQALAEARPVESGA
jgi:hypothetical protein